MSHYWQWRRQNLLRGGAKLEIVMGHSRRASGPGAADCPITNSFVTNAVLIERAELLTSAPANIADCTILGCQMYSKVD